MSASPSTAPSTARALPDWVLIGAMKCGTSTLAAQLGAQPGGFLTDPKEPNYFSDDDVFARGPAWYAGLFEASPAGARAGEASTHYAKRPDRPEAVPRLAAAYAGAGRPPPRLVYLIRDPVARLVSHYIHEWTQNAISGPLEAALEDHPALVDYGRYAMQLSPWLDRFGADAVHVDTMEAMRADPQGVLERAARAVGIEGPVAWRDELGRQNASAERLRARPLDGLLVHSAAATWLRRTLVPQALRDRVKAGRRMAARPELSAPARARLEAAFLEDRAALHALLPGRPDLDAAYPFAPDRRAA